MNFKLVALAASLAVSSACAARSDLLVRAPERTSCAGVADLGRPLRVANYNIKSGMWTSLDDIGAVLEDMNADVIALEEVDNGMRRSGNVDEAAVLAERLHADHMFAGALSWDGGDYGVALLSKVPVVGAERFALPDAGNFEPRVAIDATVCDGGEPVRVVAAHADVMPWAAKAHAAAIADRVRGTKGVVVLGDLNATPESGAVDPLVADGLTDVLATLGKVATFGDKDRIDYILTDRVAVDAAVIDSHASDHRPVEAALPAG